MALHAGSSIGTPGEASDLTVGVTTITGGTNTRILYDANGLLGETNGITFGGPGIFAISTSLAVGGATIGTNSFAVTGTSLFNSTATFGAPINYGGVTLANAVTGTGNMVLSQGPTLGNVVASTLAIGTATLGANALTIIGTTNISGNLTFNGTATGGAVTLGSAKALTLGNAAVTGLVAGTVAGLTNATIVISDATGQAYRIPCLI